MPDTGASGISTAGYPQYLALQRLYPEVYLDRATKGRNIKFGKGSTSTEGTIQVPTPLGIITFHVVAADTPFLLCIQDMDRVGAYLQNLENTIVQGQKRIRIVRKFGHPFMLLNSQEETLAYCHLTEPELRQLHRRFGHPSVARLAKLLRRAEQDFEPWKLEAITKICKHCQLNSAAPGRFKFTLRDDIDFNYCVIIDIVHLEGKPALHAVDEATAFQAAEFIPDNSARTVWRTFEKCWINTYLGPPDIITTDAGTNFIGKDFKQPAKQLSIEVKEVPVEAHYSIGKTERYHNPLRRVYKIIRTELRDEEIDDATCLQMAVKAINDTAGPDGLVPTLLVFGAYPRMTAIDPPAPSIIKRAVAIRKAMDELRIIQSKRKLTDALHMRNGPNTAAIMELPLLSNVITYREKGDNGKPGWSGPFKLIARRGHDCIIQTPNGYTTLRSTHVKPYHTDEAIASDESPPNDTTTPEASDPQLTTRKPTENPVLQQQQQDDTEDTIVVEAPDIHKLPITVRKSLDDQEYRPIGIRKLPATIRKSERARKPPTHFGHLMDSVFLTHKEESDWELAIKLRREGKITTSGEPFEASMNAELEGLRAAGVFKIVRLDYKKHGHVRIFNSRFVNEIKGKTTTPFEKSRLVIQAYGDDGKVVILTQSPTIQRSSQRIIMVITPSLFQIDKRFQLWIRDITQAYTQSTTTLKRTIISRLPKEIQHLYPADSVMVILKPLYGIPEAGTHWFNTYHNHHTEKLDMVVSTYDPCLLITTTKQAFGIVGMQTDDTLILASDEFSQKEDRELTMANFRAKPKAALTPNEPIVFNGGILSMEGDSVVLRQKRQGDKLKEVDAKQSSYRQEYIEQRARGAYIATVCQPEASFDLSIAAQYKDPTPEDIAALNRRIKWQMANIDRGITYVPIDLSTSRLYVFVDGSFANNKDFSSQLGYEIILANEIDREDSFEIYGNLIDWRSVKSQRITRSVLASEVYGMTAGVDMAYAIGSTLNMITEQLNLPSIPVIVCTDSYSLYECLVKLGTTKEKRLMIDIMAIRQSYERRELQEVRWINGNDNPADAMTKAKPNPTLETFVSTNRLTVRVEGWVKRS
jgi:hypothetical protein